MKEVTINGGYKAESHPATRHYKSETHSRGAKQFFLSIQIMKKQHSYPLSN